jgi:hypothetical protein
MSALAPNEQITVQNRFGTVTNLAVRYNVKKNLFGGMRTEDLTMRHVVSVRIETTRHVVWGIVAIIIGLIAIGAAKAPGVIIMIPLVAIGILLIWGYPKVMVTAADGMPRPSVSWPWTRQEADSFVRGVSKELMARS